MVRRNMAIIAGAAAFMQWGCSNPEAGDASQRRVPSPHFWDEIPVSPSTTVPAEIKDGYWRGQFERVNRAVSAAKDARVVFFGDSITWHWCLGRNMGQAVWEERYSKYNSVNMGNSGDITPVMLYRVLNGNLDFPPGSEPDVAVLLCGINNYIVTGSAGGEVKWDLGADCPPEDVAHGSRAVAQVFRRRLPRTRVIMMGLLPVVDEARRARCRQTNAINAAHARNADEVIYLDLADRFLLPDGSTNKALYSDGTHPNTDGYRVWADSIDPLLSRIISAPPLSPVKIMLVGDSVTEGIDSFGSYRRYLDGMLRRAGHLIDFVGSRQKHNDDQDEPDSYEFDVDHEGHWGRDSAWMARNISTLLERDVPDVALLHIGTEDIVAGAGDAETMTDGIVANIGAVMEALRSRNDSVRIVLSLIVPVQDKSDEVNALNRKIASLADTHSTARSPVVLADPHTGFDPSAELGPDGIRPNATGARRMAAAFAPPLHEILSAPGDR